MCIVKRQGTIEEFDEKKVYGSAYFACRNAHLSTRKCEEIANKVSVSVRRWASSRKSVSSDQIFRKVTQELRKQNKDAAFLYRTHRDIS